ncbi:MAG: hypothetical protein ACI8ZM_000577 [Crocinitomix sp.]|jgi:hypothetical protein
MFNKTILLLCVFTTFYGFSQHVSQGLKTVLSTFDYLKFEAYTEQVQDSFIKDEYYVIEDYIIYRDIFNQYQETYVQFQESYLKDPFEEKYETNLYNVKIISRCDTILFYEIAKQESHKDNNGKWKRTETTEATKTDLKRYKKFTEEYEEVFHTSFDITDLFTDDSRILYGFSCGLGGGLLSLRKELNSFIKTKDTVAILDWLSCARPVFQLYAIDGVLTLKKQGINFEPYVYNMIQIIAAKNGAVFTCRGCEVMPNLISEIAEGILARHQYTF